MRRGLPWQARGVVLVALLLAVPPVQAADPWWGRDKALHCGLSALAPPAGYAAGATLFADGERGLILGLSVGLGAGVAKELHDLTGRGTPSLRDLTWDMLGLASGAVLTWAMDRLFFAPAREQPPARPPVEEGRLWSLQRALLRQLRSASLELRRASQAPARWPERPCGQCCTPATKPDP